MDSAESEGAGVAQALKVSTPATAIASGASHLVFLFIYVCIFQFRIECHFDRLVCLGAGAPRTFWVFRTLASGPLRSLRRRRDPPTCLRTQAQLSLMLK